MTPTEYQEEIERTISITDRDERLLMGALGLTGEAGEVADALKKWRFQSHDLDPEHLKEELGDVAFYLVSLCNTLGFTLSDVFEANRAKLRRRYPHGFDPAASRNRAGKM